MMKIVCGSKERDTQAKVILQDGEFRYELQKEVLELPDFLKYAPLCTGCCDKEDFLYFLVVCYQKTLDYVRMCKGIVCYKLKN